MCILFLFLWYSYSDSKPLLLLLPVPSHPYHTTKLSTAQFHFVLPSYLSFYALQNLNKILVFYFQSSSLVGTRSLSPLCNGSMLHSHLYAIFISKHIFINYRITLKHLRVLKPVYHLFQDSAWLKK